MRRSLTDAERLALEARLGQYEFPAFAATMAVANVQEALRLIEAQRTRYGQTQLLTAAAQQLQQAIDHTETWKEFAKLVTDYEQALKAANEEVKP